VAVYLPLMQDRMRVGAEMFGSVGLAGSNGPASKPIEASLNGRVALGSKRLVFLGVSAGAGLGAGYAPDMRFVARIGGVIPIEKVEKEPAIPSRSVADVDTDEDGFVDADDACPIVREDHKRAEDGCPETDEDGDGIDTSVDVCPTVHEDKDGLGDEDGCPEDDFDSDGFADVDDKCPKEPGVRNEDPAKLGCPEFIERTKTEVKLVKQIEFEFRSTTILPVSFPILDEIAKLLMANADIKQLRIEGHTDNVGDDVSNQSLSVQRAKAVRDYLVQRAKVKPSRLTFAGFGQAKPIAPNDTPEGRAKNRRVELHIGDTAGGEEKVP
jgi:outer membrane protein OmpA-like peptidoglycan-associated protein